MGVTDKDIFKDFVLTVLFGTKGGMSRPDDLNWDSKEAKIWWIIWETKTQMANAEIESLRSQLSSQWISAKTSKPRKGELVIGFDIRSGAFPATFIHDIDKWVNCEIDDESDYYNVDYYMPLPSPPND